MNLRPAATTAVTMGDYIPMHDQTFDLAEGIAEQLQEFRQYVASVRTEEQADLAVTELLTALLEAAKVGDTNPPKA